MSDEAVVELGEGLKTHTVFAHVLVAKAELYRASLGYFVQAREQFITQLRPTEVAREIGREKEEIEVALRQLRIWGNLEATQDNAEQASLEEFYRVHFLYALSEAGEAAERALAVFEETLHQPASCRPQRCATFPSTSTRSGSHCRTPSRMWQSSTPRCSPWPSGSAASRFAPRRSCAICRARSSCTA